MGNVYGKMILMLGWSVLVFYDEDDNFRDKDWILTSYDNSRKEDKIRKSSTILNRPKQPGRLAARQPAHHDGQRIPSPQQRDKAQEITDFGRESDVIEIKIGRAHV